LIHIERLSRRIGSRIYFAAAAAAALIAQHFAACHLALNNLQRKCFQENNSEHFEENGPLSHSLSLTLTLSLSRNEKQDLSCKILHSSRDVGFYLLFLEPLGHNFLDGLKKYVLGGQCLYSSF
jgi:hypothetical protein